jgi:hypothetical protein
MLNAARIIFGLTLLLALMPDSFEQSQPEPSANQAPKIQKGAAEDKRGTKDQPLTVNIVPTAEQKTASEKEAAETKLKASREEKLITYTGDLVLVGLVQFLVFVLQLIAFVVQAIYMRRSAEEMRKTTEAAERVSRDQIAHSHQIERAYMSCGGVPAKRRQEEPGTYGGIVIKFILTGEFEVHVNNHGKTTGEFMRIAIGFCDATNIPLEPTYSPEPFHDWIGPGTQSRPMLWKKIDPPNASAVYGRIYYRDIFGDCHDSGFLQDIKPDGTSTALKGPPAYTTSN